MASRWTRKQITITFFDLGEGQTITAGPGPGDMTVTNLEENNAEGLEVRNRGVHDGFIYGDDHVQDLTLTLGEVNQSWTHATLARIQDFVLKTGSYADGAANAATSVDPTVWCFGARVTKTDGTNTTTDVYPKIRGMMGWQEALEGNTLSLTMRNVLEPTHT